MNQQPTFEDIQKKHDELELLRQQAEIDGVDLDISKIQEFLKRTLPQAGRYIEETEQRSQLRALIRYWSSIINDKTGKFPIIQLQPLESTPTDKRTANLIGSLKTTTNWLDYVRAKRISRKTITIISTVGALIIIVSLAMTTSLWYPSLTTLRSCLLIPSFDFSASTPSATPPQEIKLGRINQNEHIPTNSDTWTVVQGDVTYTDSKTNSPIFVKSAICVKEDDPNVGSLLAVRENGTIIGTNAASYVQYQSTASSIEQIKGILGKDISDIRCRREKVICQYISIVIIDNGIHSVYKYQVTPSRFREPYPISDTKQVQ